MNVFLWTYEHMQRVQARATVDALYISKIMHTNNMIRCNYSPN